MVMLRALISSAILLGCAIPSFATAQLDHIGTRDSADLSFYPELALPAGPAVSILAPETKREELGVRWMTNAERLARNLSPNPPKRKGPSRRHVAARTTPSPGPVAATTGRLKVTDANGLSLGYMKKTYASAASIFGFTSSASEALVLTVGYDSLLANGPAEVKVVNGPSTALPFLGFINGPNNLAPARDLGPTSPNHVFVVGIAEPGTPRGSSGSNTIANSFSSGYSQSDVWTFNVAERRLVPVWINSGLQPVNFDLYYRDGSSRHFIGTPNAQGFTTTFSGTVTGPLRFILET